MWTTKHRRAFRKAYASEVPQDVMRAIAQPACSLSLALVLVVAVAGCGSIHLDRDPDIAPAANVDRIWIPPQSVRVANAAAPRLEELRNVGESNRGTTLRPMTCRHSPTLRLGLIRKPGAPGTRRRRARRNSVNRTPAITQKSMLKASAAISSCRLSFRVKHWSSATRLSSLKSRSATTCSTSAGPAPRSAAPANSSLPPTSRSTARSRTWSSTWKRPTTSCPRRRPA